jgi:hypothetical protein
MPRADLELVVTTASIAAVARRLVMGAAGSDRIGTIEEGCLLIGIEGDTAKTPLASHSMAT